MAGRSLAPLLAAVLIPATGASAQLGPTYKNSRFGFSFKPPRDWTAVPPQPGESTKVVAFRGPDLQVRMGGYRANYAPAMQVYVFERRAVTGAQATREQTPDEDTREQPGSWDEQAGVLDLTPAGEPRQRTINRIPARELRYEKLLSAGVRASFCTFEFHGDVQVAITFDAPADEFDEVSREYEQSARTFRWIEREARSAPDQDLSDTERFLQEQITALPPGWHHLRSHKGRYLLLYNADEGLVRKLERHLEAMRDFYEEVFPPDAPITAVSICRICADRDTYHAYGGPQGSGGYWYSPARELVVFVDQQRDRNDVYSVVSHEAFHQYIFYFYGELAPHSWYNEGHGDYFGGAKMSASGRKVLQIEPLNHTAYPRHSMIKQAVQQGRHVPLREFLNWSQAQYYQCEFGYPQGWSIIYFLRNGRREGGRVQERWVQMLDDYLANLVAARDALRARMGADHELDRTDQRNLCVEAYQATFHDWTDADWREFESAWLDFYR